MQYIAKSAWSIPHINDKLNRQADGIEIQLLKKDIKTTLSDDYTIPNDFLDKKIVCIHAPLDPENSFDHEIDTVEGEYAFIKTVEFANKS